MFSTFLGLKNTGLFFKANFTARPDVLARALPSCLHPNYQLIEQGNWLSLYLFLILYGSKRGAQAELKFAMHIMWHQLAGGQILINLHLTPTIMLSYF